MFVLDDLYVSREVLDYLESSQESVFDNETAREFAQKHSLNVTSKLKTGERICALSEVHLDDIKSFAESDTVRGIELFKDKAACRQALTPLFPEFVFAEYTLNELLALDPALVNYPVVVKPSTGFFSLGIYPLFSVSEWKEAMSDIAENSASWSSVYNESVVNDTSFLVESFIEGDEYAIDAYFDSAGETVVLNILKHDFVGNEDVSDRLYYTSKSILAAQRETVENFLVAANKIFGLHDFPFHVEVRINEEGGIIPIEFNPMRFAGLCTTDVAYFAYGFKTYASFLQDKRPEWERLLGKVDDSIYTMILLTKPGFNSDQAYSFNYDAIAARFGKVLELRRTDFAKLNTFGMLFTETKSKDWDQEILPILSSSLDEYINLNS